MEAMKYRQPDKYTARNLAHEVIRQFRGEVRVDGCSVASLVQTEKDLTEWLQTYYGVKKVEYAITVGEVSCDSDVAVYLSYEASRPANESETRELVIRENSAKDKERRRLEAEFNRLKKLLGKE